MTDKTLPRAMSPSTLLTRLMTSLEHVKERLPFRPTEKRLLIVMLAYREPIGAVEIRSVVRSMKRSQHYGKVRRLQHATPCYQQLTLLHERGFLRRDQRGRRVFYSLQPGLRATIRQILADLALRGWA